MSGHDATGWWWIKTIVMHSFQRSVKSVLPFYRCRCGWERKCWKRPSACIGMKWRERWLVVHLRQNGKNRTRSYCYGTAVTAQRQVGTATAQRIFLRIGNVILTALTEFLRNLCNGNGETTTEWWKPGVTMSVLTYLYISRQYRVHPAHQQRAHLILEEPRQSVDARSSQQPQRRQPPTVTSSRMTSSRTCLPMTSLLTNYESSNITSQCKHYINRKLQGHFTMTSKV